jgi:hypothetical protein
MATYDPKQVLSDYANGKITPEMAVGHSLQHIDKLYEAVKANRHESQSKADVLDKRLAILQAAVDRLTAFMEKVRRQTKRNSPGEQPKA